jgi:hypothetical protein
LDDLLTHMEKVTTGTVYYKPVSVKR